MAISGSAQAQLTVDPLATFPASREPQSLLLWMRQATDMSPSSVVEVTATEVTGIMSSMSTPDGPSIRRVILRSEAVSAKAYERNNVLSQTSDLQIDCRSRRVKLGRAMAYSARFLIGDGQEIRAASSTWVKPIENGAEYNTILRICDGKAANPLLDDAEDAATTRVALAPSASNAGAPTIATVAALPEHETGSALKAAGAPTPGPVRLTAVQLAAASSHLQAEQVLAAIKRQAALPAGAAPRVAQVLISGKTYYRALLVGFTTRADATEFCRTVADKGGDCFVRTLPDG